MFSPQADTYNKQKKPRCRVEEKLKKSEENTSSMWDESWVSPSQWSCQ